MSRQEGPTHEVLELWNQLPDEARSDFTISFAIIREALGPDWMTKHLDPGALNPGILRLSGGTSQDEISRNYRSIDLAEIIINLKDVEGFPEHLSRMRTEEPEAGLAELHIGKMLYINQWEFRFVIPKGKKGSDYDFEIIYHGQAVAADAKCKVEATELSSKTITTTLCDSRSQLPRDDPGIFFIKIPQHWMSQPDWQRTTIQGALDFFAQGTGRIVSVVFYLEPLHYDTGTMIQGHLFKEVINKNHRFSRKFDCKLFERWKPPPVSVNSMPDYWIRLSNFPTGLPGYERAMREIR
jgi:hypothetical protein